MAETVSSSPFVAFADPLWIRMTSHLRNSDGSFRSKNTGGRMMESTRTTRGAGQRETDQASRFTQNNSHLPKGRPGGSAPQGTSPTRRVSWLRWLIFIIVINLLFYAPLLFGSSSGQPTINLPYTSFLQQVQQGHVKDVTLSGNAVSGDFKTPLQQQQSGTSGTTTYPRFTSYVPEAGDPTLLPTLEKDGVSV